MATGSTVVFIKIKKYIFNWKRMLLQPAQLHVAHCFFPVGISAIESSGSFHPPPTALDKVPEKIPFCPLVTS